MAQHVEFKKSFENFMGWGLTQEHIQNKGEWLVYNVVEAKPMLDNLLDKSSDKYTKLYADLSKEYMKDSSMINLFALWLCAMRSRQSVDNESYYTLCTLLFLEAENGNILSPPKDTKTIYDLRNRLVLCGTAQEYIYTATSIFTGSKLPSKNINPVFEKIAAQLDITYKERGMIGVLCKLDSIIDSMPDYGVKENFWTNVSTSLSFNENQFL